MSHRSILPCGRTPLLLVAGGDADPNIIRLVQRLPDRGADYRALWGGAVCAPRLTWRLSDDRLWINGSETRPTALFLRYDVFTHLQDGRPESRQRAGRWYHTLLSWALAHEDVVFLNRRYGAKYATKPYVLCMAQRLGLAVPESAVTNDPRTISAADESRWVAKPVNGGEYARSLAESLQDEAWRRQFAAEPTILQRRLLGPDLRIYRVGDRWFAFTLHSDALDYRTAASVSIGVVALPDPLIGPLRRLMDHLGLDFGAADFKLCPESGRYLFLEVNSAPMFAAFDLVAGGALSDAILDRLTVGTARTVADPVRPVPLRAQFGRVRTGFGRRSGGRFSADAG